MARSSMFCGGRGQSWCSSGLQIRTLTGSQTDRMMRVLLGFLLAFVALLHAGHSEPQTQENFDVNLFMGKWFDIAGASTCPWLKRHKGEAAIASLELKSSGSSEMISLTRTSSRHGTCKSISGEYQMTTTPGKFSYHVSKWNADVDVYVVDTNYDEYALVVMYKRKSGGEKTTFVKLYGRTMELRPTLIKDFKALVAVQGMSEDSIVMKKNKGECVPGEQLMPEPQIQRARRNVVVPPPEEGLSNHTPIFRAAEACKDLVDSGPCFGMLQRYFYNSSIMTCQMFTYGGCMGNQNNFVTQKECLQSCRTKASCRLPFDSGPCKAFIDQWAYDSSVKKCVSFTYGGCKGNGNRFYSQKECKEYCGVRMRDDASCRLPIVSGPCEALIDLWAFDSSVKKCVSFEYGGCGGNGNRFNSQKECNEYCGVRMRDDASCRLPIDSGPCEALQYMWAFDSSVKKCVSFKYGGCKGNGNRFYSQKECNEYCGVRMRDDAACRLPIDSGPCEALQYMWAFDSSVKKCVSFKYGGCKGNGNRFYSQKECNEYCGVRMR